MAVLYGVGVGPGDPELMTIKAINTIKECQVIAIPGTDKEKVYSYKIARTIIKELDDKPCLLLDFPMTKDKDVLKASHNLAADKVQQVLLEDKDVAFLTIGDPTVYSTYCYLQEIIKERGFNTYIINGVPSFCVAAGASGEGLAHMDEDIHIIPRLNDSHDIANLKGTKVVMKSAMHLSDIKDDIKDKKIFLISNAGMDNEKVYDNIEDIPDRVDYLTTLIIKEK